MPPNIANTAIMGKILKPGGRPKGSKTRPDAPSAIAARLRREQREREALEKELKRPLPIPPRPVQSPKSNVQSPAAPESKPDTELFGRTPDFESHTPPETFAPEAESAGTPPTDGTPPEAGTPATPVPEVQTAEMHRPLAQTIFDTSTGVLGMVMGAFWHPRKKGDNAASGEIPYDEREMVVTALCEYFHEIGLAVMTPAQKMWLAVAAYVSPRLLFILTWFQLKFAKKKPAPPAQPPGGDPRAAKTETVNPAPDVKVT